MILNKATNEDISNPLVGLDLKDFHKNLNATTSKIVNISSIDLNDDALIDATLEPIFTTFTIADNRMKGKDKEDAKIPLAIRYTDTIKEFKESLRIIKLGHKLNKMISQKIPKWINKLFEFKPLSNTQEEQLYKAFDFLLQGNTHKTELLMGQVENNWRRFVFPSWVKNFVNQVKLALTTISSILVKAIVGFVKQLFALFRMRITMLIFAFAGTLLLIFSFLGVLLFFVTNMPLSGGQAAPPDPLMTQNAMPTIIPYTPQATSPTFSTPSPEATATLISNGVEDQAPEAENSTNLSRNIRNMFLIVLSVVGFTLIILLLISLFNTIKNMHIFQVFWEAFKLDVWFSAIIWIITRFTAQLLTIVVAVTLILVAQKASDQITTWGTALDFVTAFTWGLVAHQIAKPAQSSWQKLVEATSKPAEN